MRYADISLPTDALIPDVPTLPVGMQGSYMAQGKVQQRFTVEDPKLTELRLQRGREVRTRLTVDWRLVR